MIPCCRNLVSAHGGREGEAERVLAVFMLMCSSTFVAYSPAGRRASHISGEIEHGDIVDQEVQDLLDYADRTGRRDAAWEA